MYLIQLLTGILFTLLGGAGGYLYYARHNNAYLAAMGLFLLIAVSCYFLALGTRRRSKKDLIIPESEEMEYEDGDYDSDYESEETGDPEDFADGSEEAAYEEYEEYDPDAEEYFDESSYYEETEEPYLEDTEELSEETDYEEEFEQAEALTFSPFYLAYIKDLLPIQQEIVHSNTTAYLEEQPIEEMSVEELESAIERTQVALNALTRLRMFCETRGTGGPEYYEEAMEHYESDPYFLTLEMLNEQMNSLRKVYDQQQEASSPAEIEEDSFSSFLNEELADEAPAEELLFGESVREIAEDEIVIDEEPSYEAAITEDETLEEPVDETVIMEDESPEEPADEAATTEDEFLEELMDETEAMEDEFFEEPVEIETEPESFEEVIPEEASLSEDPEEDLINFIEEDWLKESLTDEPVYIHPFEEEAAVEAFEENEEAASEEDIVPDAEESEAEYPGEIIDETDDAEEASPEELSPFEQLSIDENDIEARVFRVVSQNEGIHPSDLIHSFEPTLKKQVKKALNNLLDREELEKRRVGFSHGLFVVPYEEEDSSEKK